MNEKERKAHNKANKAYRERHPERVKAQKEAWRKANPDKVKAYREAHKEKQSKDAKAWHKTNKQKNNARNKAWRKTNKEKANAYHRTYRKAHPKEERAIEHRRRALKYQTQIERINEKAVFLRDGWICQICHKRVNKKLKYPDVKRASLDHIIPLSQGGNHTYANVQLAHLSCNVSKNINILPQGEQIRMF